MPPSDRSRRPPCLPILRRPGLFAGQDGQPGVQLVARVRQRRRHQVGALLCATAPGSASTSPFSPQRPTTIFNPRKAAPAAGMKTAGLPAPRWPCEPAPLRPRGLEGIVGNGTVMPIVGVALPRLSYHPALPFKPGDVGAVVVARQGTQVVEVTP